MGSQVAILSAFEVHRAYLEIENRSLCQVRIRSGTIESESHGGNRIRFGQINKIGVPGIVVHHEHAVPNAAATVHAPYGVCLDEGYRLPVIGGIRVRVAIGQHHGCLEGSFHIQRNGHIGRDEEFQIDRNRGVLVDGEFSGLAARRAGQCECHLPGLLPDTHIGHPGRKRKGLSQMVGRHTVCQGIALQSFQAQIGSSLVQEHGNELEPLHIRIGSILRGIDHGNLIITLFIYRKTEELGIARGPIGRIIQSFLPIKQIPLRSIRLHGFRTQTYFIVFPRLVGSIPSVQITSQDIVTEHIIACCQMDAGGHQSRTGLPGNVSRTIVSPCFRVGA